MVLVQLITVEGCATPCRNCAQAEAVLRRVVGLTGVNLPPHRAGSAGEFHISDGRTIEAVHLACDEAGAAGFLPDGAPYLVVDGDVVLQESAIWDVQRMAKAIMDALFPGGLAGLRP